MAQFTVITTANRVIRVKAKSVQHLTRALKAVGIKYQGLHQDRES